MLFVDDKLINPALICQLRLKKGKLKAQLTTGEDIEVTDSEAIEIINYILSLTESAVNPTRIERSTDLLDLIL